VLLLGVTACTPSSGTAPTSAPTAPAATATTATPTTATTVAPGATEPTVVVAPCATDDPPFGETGAIGSGGSQGSDAAVLSAFRWEVFQGCERIRMSLATPEGAPAVNPPAAGAQFLRHAGVLRIDLGGAISTAQVVEQVVDSGLVGRIHVVESNAGGLAVYVHLREPALARVLTGTGPAELLVDLIPGGEPYATPALTSDGLVVIPPDPDAAVYPLTITGYVAPGLTDTLDGSLESADGSIVTAESAVAPAELAWGGFAMVFPDGPAGRATITIGDAPPFEVTIR
jgi:hypothetical protein